MRWTLLLLLLSCRPATTPGTLPLGAEHALDALAPAAPWSPEGVPVTMYLCGVEPGHYAGYAGGQQFLWGWLPSEAESINPTDPVLRTLNDPVLWRARLTKIPARGLYRPGPSHVLTLHGMTGVEVGRPVMVEVRREP